MSRRKRCKDFFANTAQEKGNRRKRTSDRAGTRDLHSLKECRSQVRARPLVLFLLSPSSLRILAPLAYCCLMLPLQLKDIQQQMDCEYIDIGTWNAAIMAFPLFMPPAATTFEAMSRDHHVYIHSLCHYKDTALSCLKRFCRATRWNSKPLKHSSFVHVVSRMKDLLCRDIRCEICFWINSFSFLVTLLCYLTPWCHMKTLTDTISHLAVWSVCHSAFPYTVWFAIHILGGLVHGNISCSIK